ncbi:hypothetical protein UFOVP115_13 [uncultured Caudovirales phage]|uniref:Uncharacterized protein n=1 Tax=uncultured Caudovirales phage TaxID=2100421 RepID=A0A6J5L610_9CAUD|nr:hypothetical protein UFOVP115_13 [uncultured Caudovirales phage]
MAKSKDTPAEASVVQHIVEVNKKPFTTHSSLDDANAQAEKVRANAANKGRKTDVRVMTHTQTGTYLPAETPASKPAAKPAVKVVPKPAVKKPTTKPVAANKPAPKKK